MKYLIIFLTFLTWTSLFSQKQLGDYYLKRNVKQDGQQFQFSVLDEDKHGIWFHSKSKFYYWYKAQKVISTQGGSAGVVLNGDLESFYPNKQLYQQGQFKKGLKNGSWLYWRNDGTLRLEEDWNHGKLKAFIAYDENGKESTRETYKGQRKYSESSDTIVSSKRNGKIVNLIIKDEAGQVVRIENRKDKELHGKVKTFENGKLLATEKYKNGILIEPEKAEPDTDTGEKESWWRKLFKKKEKSESSKKDKKKEKGAKKKKK